MMQLTLFDWRTVAPPRPKQFDEVIAQKIAEDMRSVIAATCFYDPDSPELNHAVQDVVRAIECSNDPYLICKYLDDICHWDIGSETLDLFETIWIKRREIHALEVKDWIQNNGVVPNFSVGQSVNLPKSSRSGIIEKIDLEQAKYMVRCLLPFEALVTVNFEDVVC